MNRFVQGNLFLLASMISAATSQVLLKTVLRELPPGADWRAWSALLAPGRALRTVIAAALLVAGFAGWVLALSRLPLSYAYPVACASIVIVALLSALVLDEALTPRMWLGTLLVLAGVALLVPRS